MTYTVVITRDPEDEREVYNATVPAMPGCVSWGRTVAEAFAAIQEALALYLAEFDEAGLPYPPDVRCETGVVTV
mgnify:CR=1 FL=1